MADANTGPAFWKTAVTMIKPDELILRGYPMSALMGRLPFSAISYLPIRGELPPPGAVRRMDVPFSSILDYGPKKSGTLAARAARLKEIVQREGIWGGRMNGMRPSTPPSAAPLPSRIW